MNIKDIDTTRIAPLVTWEQAADIVKKWQNQGLKTGFTNGCFDILHFGHVHYLDQARGLCDRLILALNHDQSVKILKGESRPVHDEKSRAAVAGALACVDLVVLFGATKSGDNNTPCDLIETIKPDIYVKGGDYTIDQLPEAKIVQTYGGHVEVMNLFAGHSTTNSIEKMQK